MAEAMMVNEHGVVDATEATAEEAELAVATAEATAAIAQAQMASSHDMALAGVVGTAHHATLASATLAGAALAGPDLHRHAHLAHAAIATATPLGTHAHPMTSPYGTHTATATASLMPPIQPPMQPHYVAHGQAIGTVATADAIQMGIAAAPGLPPPTHLSTAVATATHAVATVEITANSLDVRDVDIAEAVEMTGGMMETEVRAGILHSSFCQGCTQL
jgi:hypothetical protein